MNYEQFKIGESGKLNLKNHKTDFSGDYFDKNQAKDALAKNIQRLSELQDVLYADNTKALLIIFQAMDAAGKDGAIKHVMSGLNPQGVQVFSFKQPSTEELDHDFLWRCAKNAPERGRIGIFNRSYYEEVLVVRVHPEILQKQPLSENAKNDKNIWKKRFEQIRNYENYLAENDVHVVKFFLNVSKKEQKERFLARIETPEKNWKFSDADAKERAFWNDYMHAYEEAIAATSTEKSPWYIIPADKKWFTRVIVSEILIKKLESMSLRYPQVSQEHRQSLLQAKQMLESEK
ncbi:MAG: Polyphosphate:AMP phosphotransferase [Acidobacteria bacterium]|jgi:PPK2 family polyphosphate:nucleotide phosphotransferase|nr:Polyphosphate:AMP phosphotransferase [Acidobacteriota bacterium]